MIVNNQSTAADRTAGSTPALYWCWDTTWHCTYASQAVADFTGCRPEELQGLGWLGFIHPDDRERFTAQVANEGNGNRHSGFICRLRHHHGSFRDVLIRAGIFRDRAQRVLGFVAFGQDLTETSTDRGSATPRSVEAPRTLCLECERIEDEWHTWHDQDDYVPARWGVQFGVCPECRARTSGQGHVQE